MKVLSSSFAAFKSGEGLKGQLLRGGVGSIAIKIASTALNLLLVIALARSLGAEAFGVYSFVFAVVAILTIPSQMGLPSLVVRETAKAWTHDDWGRIYGLWHWATRMAITMSVLLIAGVTVVLWVFSGSITELQFQTIICALPLIPLIALGNLRGAALRGLRHVVLGQLPEFILRPVLFLLILLMVYKATDGELTPPLAMMSHSLASLVTFAVGLWMLARLQKPKVRAVKVPRELSRQWLHSALPMGAVDAMASLNYYAGVLVLGVLANPSLVANFQVASQASSLVSIIMAVLSPIAAPHVASLREMGKQSSLVNLVNGLASVSLLFALLAFVLISTFGAYFLPALFGGEYSVAVLPMTLMAIAQFSLCMFGPLGVLLNMTGNEKVVLRNNVISFVLTWVGMALLVPRFGLIGAAISVLLSAVLYASTQYISVWRSLKILVNPFSISRPI